MVFNFLFSKNYGMTESPTEKKQQENQRNWEKYEKAHWEGKTSSLETKWQDYVYEDRAA